MSPLTGFIIVVIAITLQFTLYTIKRLQEPLKPNLFEPEESPKMNNRKKKLLEECRNNQWKVSHDWFIGLSC